jgi:Flp pilus assembly protein CpaB
MLEVCVTELRRPNGDAYRLARVEGRPTTAFVTRAWSNERYADGHRLSFWSKPQVRELFETIAAQKQRNGYRLENTVSTVMSAPGLIQNQSLRWITYPAGTLPADMLTWLKDHDALCGSPDRAFLMKLMPGGSFSPSHVEEPVEPALASSLPAFWGAWA